MCVLALAACAATVGATGGSERPRRDAAWYARVEDEIFRALNQARRDPPGYSSKLEALLPRFEGRVLHRRGREVPTQTSEGAAAVREGVRVLRSQQRAAALSRSGALSRAARDHVADQGPAGRTGHRGSDGATTAARASRYGQWHVSLSENIAYGQFTNGEEVITDLIVDDGVPDRGHRRNIFDGTARVAGIGCGPHRTYGSMCVIVQAGGYTEAPPRH
ncbi:MAG TPA: CAP domain-containing protein [Gemmatimonadaceae bacterium]|nr:CAP domain-containing protein [Gemmatimonadaceae bacterium]